MADSPKPAQPAPADASTATAESDASWESILDNVLGEGEEEKPRAPAESPGLAGAAKPKATAEPASEDQAAVQRLLAKGTVTAPSPRRQSLAAVFGDVPAMLPSRTRTRLPGFGGKQILRTVGDIRRTMRHADAAMGRGAGYVVTQLGALNRLMRKARITWKDMAGVFGILLILVVVVHYFAPELRSFLAR
jgi:hypothetical protein